MSVVLTDRQLCDLELILCKGFAPLRGFMVQKDYDSVLDSMRLSTGEVWPLPITLGVDKNSTVHTGDTVNLVDNENTIIAMMRVEDRWTPDLGRECRLSLGTNDTNHPYVPTVLENEGRDYIGGTVSCVEGVQHYDFKHLRMTPAQTKAYFESRGWNKVVGFQTRNPMHRCHVALAQYALSQAGEDAKLLLHPVVGLTQEQDVNYPVRVRCYQKVVNRFNENQVLLSLLPLSMRMAGPREAVLHALVRKNFGCTHFVVGRDHAGPSTKTKEGEPFYDPYDAHRYIEDVKDEIGINVITSKRMVYVEELNDYRVDSDVPEGSTIKNLSGTQLRTLLKDPNSDIPEWFSYPDIVNELRATPKRGICVYIVGLSASGKSTLAKALKARLQEKSSTPVTILDGDHVRRNLSKGLTFTKTDRSINVRRIGYVASEIVKHGGIVLCANIAPYKEDREWNKQHIGKHGRYVEVFVDTPVEVCKKRDPKGLYKKAGRGQILLTGINDPFEAPEAPDVRVTNTDLYYNIDHIVDTYFHGSVCSTYQQ